MTLLDATAVMGRDIRLRHVSFLNRVMSTTTNARYPSVCHPMTTAITPFVFKHYPRGNKQLEILSTLWLRRLGSPFYFMGFDSLERELSSPPIRMRKLFTNQILRIFFNSSLSFSFVVVANTRSSR